MTSLPASPPFTVSHLHHGLQAFPACSSSLLPCLSLADLHHAPCKSGVTEEPGDQCNLTKVGFWWSTGSVGPSGGHSPGHCMYNWDEHNWQLESTPGWSLACEVRAKLTSWEDQTEVSETAFLLANRK